MTINNNSDAMELETVNKLYLELSQFATAKTAREIKLEESQVPPDVLLALNILMGDDELGWAEISSGLTQDFANNKNSFDIRYGDGSEYNVTFSVSRITK